MNDCKDCNYYAKGFCHKEQRVRFTSMKIKSQPAAQRRVNIPRWDGEEEDCGPNGIFFQKRLTAPPIV